MDFVGFLVRSGGPGFFTGVSAFAALADGDASVNKVQKSTESKTLLTVHKIIVI